MLERDNRALSSKLSAAGVGSKEALVGLGTDDMRDAIDRRVEFRVVGLRLERKESAGDGGLMRASRCSWRIAP